MRTKKERKRERQTDRDSEVEEIFKIGYRRDINYQIGTYDVYVYEVF